MRVLLRIKNMRTSGMLAVNCKIVITSNVARERQLHNFERKVKPFRTAVPFWGQTTQSSSSLSPKWDFGPRRVKSEAVSPSSPFYTINR